MAPHSTATEARPTVVEEQYTLPRGIHVPLLTFFHADDTLDLETYYKHVQYVAKSGCAGIVALGSTGERVALSEEEREAVIKTARRALDDMDAHEVPLIAGAGDQSVYTALQSIKRAHAAGATHALVLPSSYYPGQLGKKALIDFYTALSASTPIPILLYSYPGVCSGIVIDSETVETLSQLPNIAGIKHTDHDIGKMSRHCAFTERKQFTVLGGASDYLVAALAVGARGTITGMANIAPRSVCRIQTLWEQGKFDEARALQHILSTAEWELGKGGVPIHKAILQTVRGYGGTPRAPLQPSSPEAINTAVKGFAQLMEVERKLEAL